MRLLLVALLLGSALVPLRAQASDPRTEVDRAVRALLDEARVELDAGHLDGARAQLGEAAERLSVRAIDDEASFLLHRDLEMLGRACESLPALLAARRGVLALHERLSGPDDVQTMASREQLAQVLQAMGRLEEVADLEQRNVAALERSSPDEDDLRTAWARGNLATTLTSLGRLEDAAALQQAMLASLAQTLPEGHPDLLDAIENSAHTWALLGDHDRAIALMEGVLRQRLAQLPADHDSVQRTRRNLASALGISGDLAQARSLYEDALESLRRTRGSDDPAVLSTELNLAATLQRPEERERAWALISRVHALRVESLPAEHPERLLAAQNLGVVQRARGEVDDALRLANEVYAARSRTLPAWHADRFAAVSELVLTRIVAKAEPGDTCALLSEALENVVQRLEQVGTATARERAAVAASEHDRVARLIDLASHTGCELAGLFDVIETLRHVASPLCALRTGEGSAELRPLTDEVARLGRTLAGLVASGPQDDDTGTWRGRIQEVALARDDVLAQIASVRAEEGLPPVRVESAVVARALPAHDAAVCFLRLPRWEIEDDGRSTRRASDGLLAFVLTPDGAARRVDLGSAEQIEVLVARWRETLDVSGGRGRAVRRPAASGDEREAGSAVRAAVLDALALPEDVERLLVVCDDVLHLVPFEALPLASGERLVDRLAIERELSLGRLGVAVRSAPDARASLLLVGDVDYDADPSRPPAGNAHVFASASRARAVTGFGDLPGTATEIATIGKLFADRYEREPRRLTGAAATREALFAQAPGARILHVATHGWFLAERADGLDERPDPSSPGLSTLGTVSGFAPFALSGLALAGANRAVAGDALAAGLVTAEELTGLDLSSCDLAVLSACETGVGLRRAGRGLASLQAALHAAGARRTLTSLWPVDDEAASEFMAAFYSALLGRGVTPSVALVEARQVLRAGGAPIRDWAAWVLTGGHG